MTFATVAFYAALAGLFHAYAGYPLLLRAWASIRRRPVRKAAFTPEVGIVIVVHNGAAFIERKLASCLAQDYPADRLRIRVFSDGSTDATAALARGMADPRIEVHEFGERRGKAACVNDAVARSPEPFLVMTDVRQPLGREAVRNLLENLADPEVGAVSGTLEHERTGMTGYGHGLDAYWRYEQVIRRAESEVGSMVGVMGALYGLRRECFRGVPPETILDDMYIPMNVAFQGRRVVFEPGAVVYDEALSDPARERARKVRTLAGNFQLLALLPRLLVPGRNPLFLRFVSHKIMRLLGPVLLAVAFLANAALARENAGYAAFFALQVAGYAAAALGAAWPRAHRWAPVKLAMAFVALNGFVLLGLREYLANPSLHLWSHRAQGSGKDPG